MKSAWRGAPVLDLSRATVSPIEAARAVGLAADRADVLGDLTRPEAETTAQKLAAEISFDRVRVGMLGDRPVYRLGAGRNETIVFADSPAIFSPIGRTEAEAIARRYAPDYTGTLYYDGYVTEPDQWTLQAQGQMPIHRFALDDAEDTAFVRLVSERRRGAQDDAKRTVLGLSGACHALESTSPHCARMARSGPNSSSGRP